MPKTLWIGVVLVVISLLGTVALGTVARRAHAGRPYHRGESSMGGPLEGRDAVHRPGRRYGYGMGRGLAGAIPPVEGARAVQITTTDAGCAPAEISVKVGETVTVRFVNASNGERTLIIPGQGILVEARAGQTVLTGLRTDRAGEFRFGCRAPGTRPAPPAGRILVAP
jgi:hypothetical protein